MAWLTRVPATTNRWLKILTAASLVHRAHYGDPIVGVLRIKAMTTEKTCAACDCKLDDNAINVKLGGKTVEVCCEECAQKVKEAHGSAAAQ